MQDQKQIAASLSVAVTVGLSAMELSVGLWTGAISVVANGVESAVGLIAALTAWFAVRQSAKPADATHHYGHGKFESLLSAIQALLIWVTCGFIVIEAVRKLLKGTGVDYPLLAIAAMSISVVVDLAVARYLFKVARQTDSLALEADAWHLRADAFAALAVLIGLAVLSVTGWNFLDPVLALLVAVLIAKAGYELARQAADHLLDAALPSEEEIAIRQVLTGYANRFINIHRLRTRKAGSHRYIDLHLVVRDDMTVDEAHQLCDTIEAEIHQALPEVDMTIHIESESSYRQQGDEDERTRRKIAHRESHDV